MFCWVDKVVTSWVNLRSTVGIQKAFKQFKLKFIFFEFNAKLGTLENENNLGCFQYDNIFSVFTILYSRGADVLAVLEEMLWRSQNIVLSMKTTNSGTEIYSSKWIYLKLKWGYNFWKASNLKLNIVMFIFVSICHFDWPFVFSQFISEQFFSVR